MGRLIEGLALPLGRRLVGTAQRHEELPVEGEFLHRMQTVVDAIHQIVGADMNAVSTVAEQAFAPGAEEIALAVEHDYRMLAAVEHIDVVLRIDRDAGNLDE